MTKAEFERGYAARSGLSVAQLRSLGRVVRLCTCGEDGCEGWQSLSQACAYDYDVGFDPTLWRVVRAWFWWLVSVVLRRA